MDDPDPAGGAGRPDRVPYRQPGVNESSGNCGRYRVDDGACVWIGDLSHSCDLLVLHRSQVRTDIR